MQIPQTIQAYSQLGLSIQNPRPINNFNQQTAKGSVCEFKKLFWLVDGKRMNSQELQLFLHTQIYCYFTVHVTENWSLA